MKLVHFSGDPERIEPGAFIAVVDDLEPTLAALADALDLLVRQRCVAAIDVAHDIGIGIEHDVGIDEAGAGNGRPAGVDGALDAVFARPFHHAPGGGAVLDAAEPHFAQKLHAGIREVLEILFGHLGLDAGRTGVELDAGWAEIGVLPLCRDRQCLEADDVARAARRVHLAGRDHGGDTAIHVGIDPADLVLARRPVARHRMHVAVDEAGSDRHAIGVDDRGGIVRVDILGAADGGNLAVHGDDGIGLEDGLVQVSRQYQSDVADDEFLRSRSRRCRIMGHGVLPDLAVARHTATGTRRCRVGQGSYAMPPQ